MKFKTLNLIKLFFISTLMVCFIILLTLGASAHAEAVRTVGMTTGSKTGTYYAIGNNIKAVCSSAVNFNIVESTGSLVNVERVLEDKRYQYAIVQQDALAFKALDDKKAKDKIKMIMPLYDEEIHLVATVASKIKSIADLKGKRVVVGTDGSGNWVTSQIIKAKTGIDWNDVEITPAQGVTALMGGQADAMFVVAGKPVKLLQDIGAAGTGKIKLVPIRHDALEGFYINKAISEGMYEWSPGRVSTYAVKSVLVTFDFKAQYQSEIANLTSCITKNLSALQSGDQYHAKWREVDPSDYKSVQWPVHPVAERFLKKQVK